MNKIIISFLRDARKHCVTSVQFLSNRNQDIGLKMLGLLVYLAAAARITCSNSHFMFFLSSSIPFPPPLPSTADCIDMYSMFVRRGDSTFSLYRRQGIFHRIVGVLGCWCQDTNTHFMFFLPPSHPHTPVSTAPVTLLHMCVCENGGIALQSL